MRILVIALLVCFSVPAFAQHKRQASISPGRAKVEEGYAYQAKLEDSSVTVRDVLNNWRRIARDPAVRADNDALAITYGCEGLLELNEGRKSVADSLLREAMPLFRLKQSKSYFIVALSELDRSLKHEAAALAEYSEILHTMDSMPELWNIEYYRLSGYAPLAYGIDAAYGVTRIGLANTKYKPEAIRMLKDALARHKADALTAMALEGLRELDPQNSEDYNFKVNLLCSRKPELREISDRFAKRLKEGK